MRGGRDYINDMANVSECNPFGLKRNIGRCTLVKNTDLPEPELNVIQQSYTHGETIEESLATIESTLEMSIKAPWMGFMTYKWKLTGDATKVSGGGIFDKTITVRTTSSETATFNIEASVTDQKSEAIFNGDFQHIINSIDIPIEITDIYEDISGWCSYETGIPCTTSSTYSVGYIYDSGSVNYLWNVIGADFVDNLDGTITVETSSETNTTFTVILELSDDKATDTLEKVFTHDRTLIDYTYDEDLLYDDTNIATEFIV